MKLLIIFRTQKDFASRKNSACILYRMFCRNIYLLQKKSRLSKIVQRNRWRKSLYILPMVAQNWPNMESFGIEYTWAGWATPPLLSYVIVPNPRSSPKTAPVLIFRPQISEPSSHTLLTEPPTPSPGLRQPAIGHRPPTTGNRSPAPGHRPPAPGHRPEAMVSTNFKVKKPNFFQ